MVKMMRIPRQLEATGLCRSSLYNRIKAGMWPPPVKVGARAVANPENEVAAMQAAIIAGATEEAQRALVQRLMAQRQQVAA